MIRIGAFVMLVAFSLPGCSRNPKSRPEADSPPAPAETTSRDTDHDAIRVLERLLIDTPTGLRVQDIRAQWPGPTIVLRGQGPGTMGPVDLEHWKGRIQADRATAHLKLDGSFKSLEFTDSTVSVEYVLEAPPDTLPVIVDIDLGTGQARPAQDPAWTPVLLGAAAATGATLVEMNTADHPGSNAVFHGDSVTLLSVLDDLDRAGVPFLRVWFGPSDSTEVISRLLVEIQPGGLPPGAGGQPNVTNSNDDPGLPLTNR